MFHNVSGQADVYLDGLHVGGHYGGFTQFEVVVPGLEAGEHSLVIRTDNTHDEQTIPLTRVDWFHYGGILRSVELQLLPDVYIDNLRVRYNLDGTDANVDISIRIRDLAGNSGGRLPVAITLDGETVHTAEAVIREEEAGEKCISKKHGKICFYGSLTIRCFIRCAC